MYPAYVYLQYVCTMQIENFYQIIFESKQRLWKWRFSSNISFSMYVFHDVEQMFIIDWLLDYSERWDFKTIYYFVAVLLRIGNIFYMEINSWEFGWFILNSGLRRGLVLFHYECISNYL